METLTSDKTSEKQPEKIALRTGSEQPKTEKTAYERSDILKSIFSSSPDGIVVADLEGTLIECNPAAAKLYGSLDPRELIGKTISDFMPSEEKTQLIALVKKSVGRFPLANVECLIRNREGKNISTLISVDLLKDASGEPIAYVTLIKDITERKKAEEALYQAQIRTSTILEGIADTFYSLDEDWRFTVVNPAAEKAPFDRPAAELIGKVIWDIYPNLVGTPIHKHYLDAAEKHSMQHYEAQSPLNRQWYEVFMQGRKGGVDIYMRDISERKKIEEALRESEARFKLALKNAPVTVAAQGKDLEFLWAYNQRTINPKEVVGKTDKDIFAPEDAEKLLELKRRVLETGKELKEQLWVTSNGKKVYMELFLEPIREINGNIIGIGIATVDLTKQKGIEEELNKANERLMLAQKSAGAGIWDWDIASGKLERSPEMFELFGLDSGKNEASFESWRKALHPKDVAQAEKRMNDLVKERKPLENEYRIVWPNGEIRWINALGNTEYDSLGNPVRMSGICLDVSERRHFLDALQVSETRFRRLFETALDGILILDAVTGQIDEVNPFLENMLGYSHSEFLGKKLWEIGPFKDTRLSKDAFKELQEKGNIRYEDLPLETKDGKKINVEFVSNIYTVDHKNVIQCNIRDITERRIASEKMEHLASFPRLNPNPVLEVDSQGIVTFANPAVAESLKKIGLEADAKTFLPANFDRILEDFRKGKESLPLYNEIKIKDRVFGQRIYTSKTLNAIRIYAFDITDQKVAEEEILREKENLQKIFDVVEVGMLLIDEKGKVERVNNMISKWVGKDLSDCGDMQPGDILDCVHAVTDSLGCGNTKFCGDCPIRNAFESVLKSGEFIHNVEIESTLVLGGKESRLWLETSVDPIILDGKRHVLLSIADITDRKNKEKELVKLNRTLKAVGDSNQALLNATDESKYLDKICKIIVNDCGYQLVWIGFAENDAEKSVRPVAQAGFDEGYLEKMNITWADSERGRGPTGTAIRTGATRICKDMLTDPNFKPWREEAIKRGYSSSISIPMVPYGKVIGALTIYSKEPNSFSNEEVDLLTELANDLSYGIMTIRMRTAHKKAEEELRETKDYLENLFDSANAPIVCWDPNFRITRFNHAFEYMSFYTAEEILGKDLSILFPEPARDELLEKINMTLTGEKWDVVEIPILRKDGKIRIALWNSANIYSDDGKTLIATIAQGQDITERKAAEVEVKASLKEKEELLKEVHHRVKNNLQVISSLLSLQSKYIKDEETADLFKQSQSRIQSIALIHEKLYQEGDFTKIDFNRYVADLTNNLLRTYGMGRVKVNLDIKDVLLNIEYAIPCGLVINEMVTNSLKHAFPGGRDGNINIIMRKTGDDVELVVADDGTGMRGIDPRNSKTLGMQLLTNIVEKQLEGKIALDAKNGTKFKIKFRVE